jgi:hypothetical protein
MIVGRDGGSAVAWQQSSGVVVQWVLPTPSSGGIANSALARGVNTSSEIVGEANGGFPPSGSRAVYWPSTAGPAIVLHPMGWTQSYCNSISESSAAGSVTIVGAALSPPQGAVWYRRGLTGSWESALASELQLGLPDSNAVIVGLGDSILSLKDVNSSGWMVGEFQLPGDPHAHAMLILPMACQGDLNADGIVDAADLAALNVAWGACAALPCPADLTGDGLVDAQDLGQLLLEWGRDCDFEAVCASSICTTRSGTEADEPPLAEAVTAALSVFGHADCTSFCNWFDELPEEHACCVRQILLDMLDSNSTGGAQ